MNPLTCFATSALAIGSCAGALTAQSQGIQLTTGVDGGVIYQYDDRFIPSSGITVEAWITFDDATIPNTGQFYWPTIARMNVTPNQESWNFRVQSANTGNRALSFIIRAQNNALYNATYNFAPGEFLQFTHVAGTFDGQTIKIFKDGVQVATSTIPAVSAILNNQGELRVGNGDAVAPGNEAWNGIIDELRIWPMAREAGEIAAAMPYQTWFMPGGVLEFDYDGTYNEFSNGIVGTAFGTIGFAPGNTNLAIVAPNSAVVGMPTSTCATTSEIALGSLPELGNNDFRVWSVRGPVNSGFGIVVAAVAPAPASQPPVVGVDLAFDLNAVLAQVLLIPPTNVLGNSFFNLPIPNNPGLSGVTLIFQFGFDDVQCGPQGFSAGSGLSFSFM